MSRSKETSQFNLKLRHMRLEIAPIVSEISGQPPPEFPSTILQLFLLTEDQLDAMAHFYSQIEQDDTTDKYPQRMHWDPIFLSKSADSNLTDYERLGIKRRMFAKFIGMRGAETPKWEVDRHVEMLGRDVDRRVNQQQFNKSYRGPPKPY